MMKVYFPEIGDSLSTYEKCAKLYYGFKTEKKVNKNEQS